jgi:hypothetical protein
MNKNFGCIIMTVTLALCGCDKATPKNSDQHSKLSTSKAEVRGERITNSSSRKAGEPSNKNNGRVEDRYPKLNALRNSYPDLIPLLENYESSHHYIVWGSDVGRKYSVESLVALLRNPPEHLDKTWHDAGYALSKSEMVKGSNEIHKELLEISSQYAVEEDKKTFHKRPANEWNFPNDLRLFSKHFLHPEDNQDTLGPLMRRLGPISHEKGIEWITFANSLDNEHLRDRIIGEVLLHMEDVKTMEAIVTSDHPSDLRSKVANSLFRYYRGSGKELPNAKQLADYWEKVWHSL